MLSLTKLYNWYGKKTVLTVLSLITILLLVAVVTSLSDKSQEDSEVETGNIPTVFVGSSLSLSISNGASFIGTVRAVSEAAIQSETGGRVTSVRVQAGDTVSAGAIIATLENASENAAVLQAQGAYEAALAAGASSDVSLEQAQNSLLVAQNGAVSTNRSVYSSANNILLNTIDQFFSNPQSGIIGFKLDGNNTYFNNARTQFRTTFPAWATTANTLTASGDIQSALTTSNTNVRELLTMVDALITSMADDNNNKSLTSVERQINASAFATDKATLNTLLSNLETAETTLTNAQEAVRLAQIGGTTSDVSAANAQIKQALGGLRSAQATLAKTILRTPISGTVNTLQVNIGDFIGNSTQIAEVANNGSLEITLFLGESDVSKVAIGDQVLIEGIHSGVISNIAPALDSQTLKTEVKIATEAQNLTNGDTVTVALDSEVNQRKETDPILVPITAVKFTATDGAMFVVEDGTLQSLPVTLGNISGSYIAIAGGIEHDTVFVLDARGLSVGQTVEAISSN